MDKSNDRFVKKLTKLAYYVSLVMILSGMFLSMVSQPAQASGEIPTPPPAPQEQPTSAPQQQPTSAPQEPTSAPPQPTSAPQEPTSAPQPTSAPVTDPTAVPTVEPPVGPTSVPTVAPTQPPNPKNPDENPVTPPTNVIINNGSKGIMVVPEGFSLQQSAINAQADKLLTVRYECGFYGSDFYTWVVENPNTVDVAYTWQVTAGGSESGSGVVRAGDFDTFSTPVGSRTVAVYVDNVLQGSATSNEDQRWCKRDVELSYTCSNGGILFSIFNPNGFSLPYTYNLDGASGSGNIPPGGTGSVFATTTGAHTLTVSYSHRPWNRSVTTNTKADTCVISQSDLQLAYSCITNSGQIQWTVSNPNGVAVTFNWSQQGAASGTDTVGPNGSITFLTTPGGAQTVSITFAPTPGTTKTISQTTTANFCMPPPPPQNLTISYACVNGLIQWTVNNPNSFDVAFNWSRSGSTDSGNDSAPANGSKVFYTSPNGAQTVSISWSINAVSHSTSGTSPAGYCTTPPPPLNLTVSFACVNNQIEWTVNNPNLFAVGFTWSRAGSTDSGSDSAPANGSKVFYTSPNGAQTVNISWTINGTSYSASATTPANFCTPPPPPLSLSVTYTCGLTGQIEWTVNNPNNFIVGFTWSRAGSPDSGSDSAPANGSKMFYSSPNGAQTVTIGWTINNISNSASATSPTGYCVTPPPPLNLTVSYACTNGLIEWTVTNPNNFDVNFVWSRAGSPDSGTDTAPGNGSKMFYTSPNGAQTVSISWTINGTPRSSSATTPANYCTSPLPQDLTISFACIEGQTQWTVRNPNNFDVSFTWSRAGSTDSGSDTAPANNSKVFTTSPSGAQTITIVWTVQNVRHTKSLTTPADYCVPPTIKDLKLSYSCGVVNTVFWTVTNPNNFSITFSWSETDGPSGNDTVAAKKSLTFHTSGEHKTVSITWTSATGETRTITKTSPTYYCASGGKNNNPPSDNPSLGIPPAANGGGLIPVTGADLTAPLFPFAGLKKLLLNLGMVFLGMAFILHGMTRRPKKRLVHSAENGDNFITATSTGQRVPKYSFTGLPRLLLNLGMVFLGAVFLRLAFIQDGVTRKRKKK